MPSTTLTLTYEDARAQILWDTKNEIPAFVEIELSDDDGRPLIVLHQEGKAPEIPQSSQKQQTSYHPSHPSTKWLPKIGNSDVDSVSHSLLDSGANEGGGQDGGGSSPVSAPIGDVPDARESTGQDPTMRSLIPSSTPPTLPPQLLTLYISPDGVANKEVGSPPILSQELHPDDSRTQDLVIPRGKGKPSSDSCTSSTSLHSPSEDTAPTDRPYSNGKQYNESAKPHLSDIRIQEYIRILQAPSRLLITSWNVCGLNDQLRKLKVKDFVRKKKPLILALQETKLTNSRMKIAATNITPSYTVVASQGRNGGRTTLLLHPLIALKDSGRLTDGNLTWARADYQGHSLHVAVVYGPHTPGYRA
ncbi:hypothetical protein R1flu_010295 [Riccia fluitans]|uniref:Uncharacterized protein n=1 Tax=Riccia fluitans TaxID=41844 RepID=A0ABD1Z5H5_9MARC